MALTDWGYASRHIGGNDAYSDKSLGDAATFVTGDRCLIYRRPAVSGANPSPNSPTSKDNSAFTPLGLIQAYNFMEQRQIEIIWELGSSIPYIIPGRAQGQISLSRVYVFGVDLLNALHGTNDSTSGYIGSLKDARKAFDMAVVLFGTTQGNLGRNEPDEDKTNNAIGASHQKTFRSCWMNSRNESVSGGQLIIMEQVSIMYEQINDVRFSA